MLNGNHETMNVAGRFTYATPPAMSDFLQWHSLARLDAALRVPCPPPPPPLPPSPSKITCVSARELSANAIAACAISLLWCLSQERCGKKASPYAVPPLPTEHKQYAHIILCAGLDGLAGQMTCCSARFLSHAFLTYVMQAQ